MTDVTKLAALCICTAMVASSLAVSWPAKATDTNNNLFTALPGAPVGVTFYDVAWSDDGKLALFVGTDFAHGKAYYYQPAGDVWTEALYGGGFLPCYQLFTAIYCPNSWNGPKFAAAGTSGPSGYFLWFPGPGQDTALTSAGPLQNFDVHDIVYNPAVDSMGSLFVCANAQSGVQIKLIQITLVGGGFNTRMIVPKTSAVCNGVEYDPATNDVYIVGSQSSGILYHKFQYNNSANYSLEFPYGSQLSDIVFDSHHTPDRMIITALYQNIGDVTSVYDVRLSGGCYQDATPIGQSPDYTYFNAIAMDDEGRAVIVGMDDEISNEGRIYDLWTSGSGTTYLMKRAEGSIISEEYRGVAIRPTGVQMALIAGSAFKYSYTSVVGPIQVDTGVPHVNFLEVYPWTGTIADSVLNTQIDVDIGDSGTVYTVGAEVYDPLGVARMTMAEFWLWHDGGGTLADIPDSMGATFDNPGDENLRMHFTIDSLGTVTQLYPAPAIDEETSQIGGSWNIINTTSAFARINFSPHQQVRWAVGPFTELPVNMRYDPDLDGPEPGEQSTVNALNDANTWDVKVRVRDDAPTPNYASAYDELGFYKYTYLGAAGIPNGGAVYGSGAPGTTDVVMSVSGSDVTYCANCPYGLSVTLSGNLIGVAHAGVISAAQVSTMGAALAVRTAFAAGGGPVPYILPGFSPLNSERVTTTSSFDGNAGTSEPVRWWVNIPGVVEDSYVSTITWSITN